MFRVPLEERDLDAPAADARDLLVQYFEQVLNGKRLQAMDQIFAPDVVYHSAGSADLQGLGALKDWVAAYLAAVPDYHATLLDSFGVGDRAVLRWSCTGTQKGILLGFAPSGKHFTLTGMTVFRVTAGRVVEGWIERDSLGLFRQLEGAPMPGTRMRTA